MLISYLKKRSLLKEIKAFKKYLKGKLKRDEDILAQNQREQVDSIVTELSKLEKEDPGKDETKTAYHQLYNKYKKAIPNKKFALLREYTEIFIVALTVAFGVRALYLQPFKIPTGSMQPTLFGIHYIKKDVVPDIPQPFNYALFSTQRAKAKIKKDGELKGFYPPYNKLLFFPWTAFKIGGERYELPGTREQVKSYCFNNNPEKYFEKGTTLCNGWLSNGDHLFVDRLSYHFIEPQRGDIVIFTTENIKKDKTGKPLSEIGFYYVKRLVGKPGDILQMKNDMLYVKPKNATRFLPITSLNPQAFNKIFSDKGGYQGYLPLGRLKSGRRVKVPPNSYFMLGDNTTWSADSRYWGFVPKENIIGKAFFVFWPFSKRWGIVDNVKPVEIESKVKKNGKIPAMNLQ